MNLWIAIALCLVVGLLVFGKNPLREFQNKQHVLMEKYGKDELTAATNMYLEQKQKQSQGPGSVLGGAGNVEKKSGDQSASDMKAAIRNSATVVGNDQSYIQPKAIYIAPPDKAIEGNGASDIIIQQGAGGGSQGSANGQSSGAISGYYPPIIGKDVKPAGSMDRVQRLTGNEPKLRSGQPLAFEGSTVYAIDEHGDKRPLPDGEYTLQDGTSMVVSGGHRLAGN